MNPSVDQGRARYPETGAGNAFQGCLDVILAAQNWSSDQGKIIECDVPGSSQHLGHWFVTQSYPYRRVGHRIRLVYPVGFEICR